MKKRSVVLILVLLLGLLLCACSEGTVTVGDLPTVSAPVDAVDTESVASEAESPTGITKPPSMADAAQEAAQEPEPQDAPVEISTSEIILGRTVFIHEAGVAFYGAAQDFCSTLVDENGELYDFYVEAELPYYIWALAIVDDNCYLATGGGFYRLNLTEFSEGSTMMELLCDITIYNGFSIHENWVYFLDGSDFYRLSLEDESLELILSSVRDFELTNEHIYYTASNGGLYRLTYDCSDNTLLADTSAESKLLLRDSTAFFWSYSDTYPQYYDLNTGAYGVLPLLDMNTAMSLWFLDDQVLYSLSDTYGQRYDLTTGESSSVRDLVLLPEKFEATQVGDMLYYCYASGVFWANLREGWQERMSVDSSSTPQISEDTDAVTSATTTTDTDHSDYNISAGLDIVQSGNMAVISTDHFTMELPADISWSMRIVDESTLEFFHTQAAEDGYGGVFLTIYAFDEGDDRYLDWPDYSTLGVSNGKQYIATRPTDVQFNTSDETQAEEYRQLLFHANLFYEFELDNPFHLK